MAEKEVGTVIPGEEEGHDAGPERVATAIVEKAKKDGWRPLEEWKGDPADWVDAKEFNGRKSLFEKIGSLKSELQSQRRSFDSDMSTIKNYVQQLSKIEYEKALRDLKATRRDAITERDVEAVEALDTQIAEVEKQRATPVVEKKVDDTQQKFADWKEKNSWYSKDTELKNEADSIGIGYGIKNPTATPEDVFVHVEKTIKKLYPEKFRPSGYLDSSAYNGAVHLYGHSASNSGTIFKGDMVQIDDTNRSTGLADVYAPGIPFVKAVTGAMTTTVFRGVAVGFVPQPEFSQSATASLGTMYVVASTARYVWVVDDYNTIFEVQESGTNSYVTAASNAINMLTNGGTAPRTGIPPY